MTYNAKLVKPKIEFYEVKDSKLHSYWPKGVTRLVMEFIKPGLKENSSLTFTVEK